MPAGGFIIRSFGILVAPTWRYTYVGRSKCAACRHRRRRTHSFRTRQRSVRRGRQPGDAHRDVARCGRALRLAGPARGRGCRRRGHEAFEPVESDARVRARLRTGGGNARARSAARLRDRPRGGDCSRQQDSARTDRLRHRRGRGHRQRSSRGLSEGVPAALAQELSRQIRSRTSRAVVRIAPEASAPRTSGARRAAHRFDDGREHRTHGQDLGNHPRRAGPVGPGEPSEGDCRL